MVESFWSSSSLHSDTRSSNCRILFLLRIRKSLAATLLRSRRALCSALRCACVIKASCSCRPRPRAGRWPVGSVPWLSDARDGMLRLLVVAWVHLPAKGTDLALLQFLVCVFRVLRVAGGQDWLGLEDPLVLGLPPHPSCCGAPSPRSPFRQSCCCCAPAVVPVFTCIAASTSVLHAGRMPPSSEPEVWSVRRSSSTEHQDHVSVSLPVVSR